MVVVSCWLHPSASGSGAATSQFRQTCYTITNRKYAIYTETSRHRVPAHNTPGRVHSLLPRADLADRGPA